MHSPAAQTPAAARENDALERALGEAETRRLLRLRVPVITQLAAHKMAVGAIRKLSVGTIIEFDKPIDRPLDLMVNNQAIANGEAVKVGERFGLRLKAVNDRAARIQSLGK